MNIETNTQFLVTSVGDKVCVLLLPGFCVLVVIGPDSMDSVIFLNPPHPVIKSGWAETSEACSSALGTP